MSSPPRTSFVIGSRESDLALCQSRHVQSLLQTAHPGCTFTIRTSLASGDIELSKPLHELAAANPGLFTKELEVRVPPPHTHASVCVETRRGAARACRWAC